MCVWCKVVVCIFARVGVGVGVCVYVCVDLFAVHKQAPLDGTARCIFEKCTVKNYFMANNTLCQFLDLLNHFVGLQK
jgi:hypothetical protein